MSATRAPITEIVRANRVTHVPDFWPKASAALASLDRIPTRFPLSDALPSIRIFRDNGNRADLIAQALHTPMQEADTLDLWLIRVLQGPQYCFAMNGVSAWDDYLADAIVGDIVSPIAKTFGFPTRGMDVYLFAGRYRYTPFGIHTDSENSILLHIGPATKRALVWERDVYEQVADRNRRRMNNFDIPLVERFATEYQLAPGDLLYIPRLTPHVMTSDSFSATLGVIPNPATYSSLMKHLLFESAAEHPRGVSDASFLEPSRLDDFMAWSASYLRDIIDKGSIETALSRSLWRLRSNGFLVPAPVLSACNTPVADAPLTLPPEYPIITQRDGGALRIFARGREITVTYTEAVVLAIQHAADSSQFCLDELRAILLCELDPTAASAILRVLINGRAFRSAPS